MIMKLEYQSNPNRGSQVEKSLRHPVKKNVPSPVTLGRPTVMILKLELYTCNY
jgi:hypothetical protein